MWARMQRLSRIVPVTIGTAVAGASSVRLDDMAGSAVIVRGHTTSAVLTIYSSTDDVTWAQVISGGAAVTMTLPQSNAAVDVPGDLFGARFVRLVSDRDLAPAAALMAAKA